MKELYIFCKGQTEQGFALVFSNRIFFHSTMGLSIRSALPKSGKVEESIEAA